MSSLILKRGKVCEVLGNLWILNDLENYFTHRKPYYMLTLRYTLTRKMTTTIGIQNKAAATGKY